MYARLIVNGLLALVLAVPVAAQLGEPEGPNPLPELRSRSTIGEEERAQIQEFVAQNLAGLQSGDALRAQAAMEQLRAARQASEAFRTAYAEIIINAVRTGYTKADVGGAVRLIVLLNLLDTPNALPVLLEALQDERVGVRAGAAVGLRQLQPAIIQQGPDTCGRVLDALSAAGAKEKSCDTLRAIYEAMNYTGLPNQPDVKRSAVAVLALLRGRGQSLAEGKADAVGADDVGLGIVFGARAALSEDEVEQFERTVATMLKYAIERYATGPRKLALVTDRGSTRQAREQRDAIERLILVGEDALVTLLEPPAAPSVSTGMRQANTTKMKNEWQRWVGLLQTKLATDYSLAEPAEDAEGDSAADGATEKAGG